MRLEPLTTKGQLLKPTNSAFMASAAQMWIEANLDFWSTLVDMLQRPDEMVVPYFSKLSQAPQLLNQYHQALKGYALQDYQAFAKLTSWESHNKVLDIGCGSGSLLMQLLQQHPHLHGIFCDLPEIITQLQMPPHLEDRVEYLPLDFFKPWSISADAVILSRVLHDWPDMEAEKILCQAHQALLPDGHLYIIEMILDDESPKGGLLDLNMLVATGGQERSNAEWEYLLAQAQFKIETVKHLSSVTNVIIATPL